MSSVYIAAAHKSSGKTTLSIGLGAALRERGLKVQAFKKGPDYIDPIWLSQATGRPCHNLDFFTSGHDFILDRFNYHSRGQDVTLVEGNMGLFDGMSLDGSDSNAAMAKLLNLPVILVVDCTGTSRGIAPLLKGYQDFDAELEFAGVILNKTAGSRHETKLTEVIKAYTDFEVLGTVPRNADIQLTERHLGLIPSNELAEQSDDVIHMLAQQAKDHIDIDRILEIKAKSDNTPGSDEAYKNIPIPSPSLRIAVAMDEAFGFYYPGDLDRFAQLGVEIVQFNALQDDSLPENIDGLFIGGGFPETQLKQLSTNTSLLSSIKQAIESGLPSYAECGGLMYLCRDLKTQDKIYPLCDVIPSRVHMNKRPQGRGYIVLQANDQHPWYQYKNTPSPKIKAHEFHYSNMEKLPDSIQFAYSLKRGTGIDGINDGIILNNLVASYAHLRTTDQCSWVDDFVSFVNYRKRS